MKSTNKTRIEESVQNGVRKAQQNISGFLNYHFNKLSKGFQKSLLVFFGLVIGAYCIMLIAQSISGEANLTSFKVNEISIPGTIQSPDGLTQISEDEYDNILNHKLFLDSLKASQSPVYDSVLTNRPGLYDSLDQLLKLMEHHQINH